ncbi:FAD-binding protein [Cryptosporangium sp. NPDC048952]|uniref:FAD-binding protein n=1 Tax=Cryptosporangium sp. NPDC048952 TaxID=3363961 RepID=UPI00371E9672
MATRDESFDFVIVGSGGGGLVAALAAHEAGLKPVVIEKQAHVGGSTGMSGGIMWMPNNPLMRAERVPDSFEQGLTYFESVIGPPDQGSSLERRKAFLTSGPEMITLLQRKGVKLVRCEGYSDYYSSRKGGSERGRSVEGIPWDGRQLGEWQHKVIPGMGKGMGMAVKTNEVRDLPTWTRSFHSLRSTVRVGTRTYLGRLRKRDLFTNGMSLVGQITKILVGAGVPIWLNTGVEDLVVEGGRVVGVRAVRNGEQVLVRGTKGVLLAAGGFERNPEMRKKYSADTQPNDGQWTMANPGNTGEVLAAAIAVGAKTDYMDDAVWLPNPRMELAGTAVALGRQYPHAMFVNQHGKRFVNESNSYLEVGKAMYANDAVPAWLIFDDAFRKRYPWARGLPTLRKFASVLPGRMPEELVTSGMLKRAATLQELAAQIEVDPEALVATVGRFNVHAAQGEDPDFGRGESQYNRVLGDPGNKPNQALGPVDTPPFYATQIYPGDVGTIGGVITDEFGRALDEADAPIPGLYVTGNMAATVMGRTYPGAGASISNTMTFGYIAALHAAGK